MVNWNQGTKACTVLVGENTESKPASTEANKTSSSRPRQQSSSGGNNSYRVYMRKRRDTPNQHAQVLHQTSQASETSSKMQNIDLDTTTPGPDPGPVDQPGTTAANSLHEDISKSVHAELSGHENEQVSGVALTTTPKLELSYSGSSYLESVLNVNVSSSTNSFLDRLNLMTTVNPLSKISSDYLDSNLTVFDEISSESNKPLADNDTLPIMDLAFNSWLDYGYDADIYSDDVVDASTVSDDIVDTSTISDLVDEIIYDSSTADPKLRTTKSPDTINSTSNLETVNIPDIVDPVSINDSSRIDFGKSMVRNKSENRDLPIDHLDKSSLDSKHVDSSTSSLFSGNDNTEPVNIAPIDSDTKSNDEVLPVALPLVVNRLDSEADTLVEETTELNSSIRVGEMRNGTDEKGTQITDRPISVTISNDDDKILSRSNKKLNESENAKIPGVIKETRELSREDSSSEFVSSEIIPSSASSEKSEELQRDYPVFSYDVGEVEIIKLHDEQVSTTMKSEIAYEPNQEVQPTSNLATNDVGSRDENVVSEVSEVKRKENLQVVNAEDEILVEKISGKVEKEGVTESDDNEDDDDDGEESNSVQQEFSEESNTPNNHGNESLHEKHESQKVINASSITPNKNAISEHPLTHQVQIVQMPRGTESERQSRRVLVNVTISTEDFDGNSGSKKSSHPLYMLSVSVPTDGQTNNFPGINISPIELPTQTAMSSMGDNPHVEPDESTTRIPPPPQPPTSPPPSWGGECECSCPCMDSHEKDNFSEGLTASEEALFHELGNDGFSSSYEDSDLFNSSEDSQEKSNNNSSEIHNLEGLFEIEESTTESWLSSSDLISTESTTYPTEVTTEGFWCSGTTPLPPEPIILILEGEALFSILLFFYYCFS